MVKLFLFRLGSLLSLLILLVWEAFYSQNEENYAGIESQSLNQRQLCYFASNAFKSTLLLILKLFCAKTINSILL